MSILSALKQEQSSLDELAKLPQTAIMQMVQHKQIDETMLAPILARKSEMMDAVARTKALAGAGQQQPTVMEQMMAKNAAAENPAPQMPMMAQQMPQAPEEAGVGQLPIPDRQYAGGGIVAFDGGGMAVATDDDDEYDDYQSAVADSQHNSMMDKLYSMIKNSYVGEKAAKYMPSEGKESTAKRGSHPYEDMVIAEAKKQGVDPKLALHVLYKETGGLKNPESARSKAGAVGVMQLMPATAKELGVNPNNPEENIHGGVKYLAKLGKMFDNDPRLVAAGYNAGPGNVRKHGGVPNFQETRNYVRGLAEGGIVGYAGGGMPLGLSPGEEVVDDGYIPTTPEEQDYFKNWIARQEKRRGEAKANAAEDRNMALLTAGLGMMAGTSPYAMTNIGAGALQGAQAYGASKRARTAEELAMDKMEVGALGAKTKQEQLNEYRKARLEESKRSAIEKADAAKSRAVIDQEDKTRRAGINAQARAAQNPAYKAAAKALEGLSPDDPMYQYNVDVMSEIENSYMTGRGIKLPAAPVKPAEPSIMDKIKGVFGGSKSPGRMTFDKNGNPI